MIEALSAAPPKRPASGTLESRISAEHQTLAGTERAALPAASHGTAGPANEAARLFADGLIAFAPVRTAGSMHAAPCAAPTPGRAR